MLTRFFKFTTITAVVFTTMIISSLSFAGDIAPTFDDAKKAIALAAEGLDTATVEVMKANLIDLQEGSVTGFKRMSNGELTDTKNTVLLTCVIGQAALVLHGRLGICLDGQGNVYNLRGSGYGLSLGARGSLVMGIVKYSDNSIRGRYRGFSMGSAAANKAINLGRAIRGLNVGLGIDVIGAESGDRSLVLVGPSIGAMIDLSLQEITID